MGPDSIRGIEHIPGFRWLINFMGWSATLRLPFMSVLTLVIVIAPLLLGASIVDSMTLLVTIVMTGSITAVLVILASGAQDDLQSAHAEDYLDKLSASSRGGRMETPIGLLLGIGNVTYFGALFDGSASSWLRIFTLSYYENNSAGAVFNELLLLSGLLLSGVLIVYIFAFGIRQVRVFSEWATGVEIDLVHAEDLQVFSLQPLRYLLITVLFASLNIIVYQVLSVLDMAEQAFKAQIPLVLFMLICGVPFLGPINIIRRRIAEAKLLELSSIRSALAGNRAELANSQISHVAAEFKTPDLLAYEQQIKGVWDWPIQGYVQRILLYVLLPPMAWVLAALVEQIVDAFVS